MGLKKVTKNLMFPPIWVLIILIILCAVMLVSVFIKGWQTSPIAYITYVLSFYTLSVLGIFFSMVLPKRYRALKGRIYANPLGNRFMTDPVFKARILLYASLIINLLYVAANVVSGILYGSAWFAILAGYYSILSIMRFLLVRFVKRNAIGKELVLELKRARLCGFILMTLNLTLSAAVLMILYQDKGYQYHGILIYVMAMYTFFITVQAVRNIIKYRKLGSPVMSTAKVISLTAALVSILNLETAMLSQFGTDMAVENKRLMIMLTGAGVSAIVVTMALYIIIKTTKEIKNFRGGINGK